MATREDGRKPRQAAVFPIRRSVRSARVCLIRRIHAGAWGIPKGFIDPGHTAREAALNEAHEEAGLAGRIVGGRLGTYTYEKRGASFTVAVYVMDVLEEAGSWREMRFRERRWCTLREAGSLLSEHPAQPLLDLVKARLR